MPTLENLLNLTAPVLEQFLERPNAVLATSMAVAALLCALLTADRIGKLRVFLIDAFAMWMISVGQGDIGATVAAFAVLEALRSLEQKATRSALASIDGKVRVLHDTIEPFIEALDRRSHQIDLWKAQNAPEPEVITAASAEKTS